MQSFQLHLHKERILVLAGHPERQSCLKQLSSEVDSPFSPFPGLTAACSVVVMNNILYAAEPLSYRVQFSF
jgi:hypothetical protein